MKNPNLAPLHNIRDMSTTTGTPLGPGWTFFNSFDYSTTGSKGTHVYPSSALVGGLDVSKWTTTIEDKYFDRKKGKGLIAKEQIFEGQFGGRRIENPFIIARTGESIL